MKKFSLVFVVLIIAVSIVAIVGFFTMSSRRDGAAVVKQIKELNRWETSSYSIEKIIDSGNSGNIFQRVLFGNRILLIAHGEVVGGFDLSTMGEDDIKIDGDRITVVLPAPTILSARLDESLTRVYDRQKGLLVESDNNLESDARLEAVNTIRQAACTQGILTITQENGRKQLTSLLLSLGFEYVTVEIPSGSC